MKKSIQSIKMQACQLRVSFFVFLFCLFSLVFINELPAQEYTFPEIREILLRERAQTGDLTLRKSCFGSIDDLIIGTYPPLHSDTKGFYTFMIKKALQEIKTENVTEGATIWQIYNHGFVVKTSSSTFGVDLYDYFNLKEFLELTDLIDVYFITHQHGDHYSSGLITGMKNLGKPVVGPSDFSQATIKMAAGEHQIIAGLKVTAHDGLHSVPVRQYEIVTLEGLKFLHTGDNQTSETLPKVVDIDVMLLNAWINESGVTSWIEGVRIAINKMKPKVTLPGHILELGHLYSYNAVPYRDPIASDNGSLASEYYVLAWGERYHYSNASNDSIPPKPVTNLDYTILADSITFSWDLPQQASDGDSASFYRIILNNSENFLTTHRKYQYTDFTSELNNIKVYSYDDCGNQSSSYSEIKDLKSIVTITFRVIVPDFTPSGDLIYISGTFNRWDPGISQTGVDGSDLNLPMTSAGGNKWQITLPFTAGETIEYKYTRGSWDNVEKGSQGEEIPNRMINVPSINFTQMDAVANWRDIQTSVKESRDIPLDYNLSQNYPNPGNPSTTISFIVPRLSRVKITIYNVFGQEVRTLTDEDFEAGTHSISWDGLNNSGMSLSSGIYFYQMRSEDFVKVRKALMLR
jgi:hypothetical protein